MVGSSTVGLLIPPLGALVEPLSATLGADGVVCAATSEAAADASPTTADASPATAAVAAVASAAIDAALVGSPGTALSAYAAGDGVKSARPSTAAAYNLHVRASRADDVRLAAGALSPKIVCTLPRNS